VKLLGFERRWAQTIGRALVPAGALDGALEQIDLGQRYADECAISPWYAALLLRFCLWLIWLAPFPRTFGGIGAERRVETLEQLLKHRVYPLRMATMMFKLSVCSMLLGDEATLQHIGAYKLDGRSLVRKREAS
jgi:hypothetical protein